MGLAAILALAACGGSSSDDSADTTTLVEVPDVTEVTDDEATAEDLVPAEGTTPGSTSDLPAWTTFTTADGLASNDVIAVDVHADGTTWAMTVTSQDPLTGISLSRFDDGTWTTFDVPERFSTGPRTLGRGDLTDGLAAGPNGTAWYLGGGLWEFDGDSWTTVHECDGQTCPEVPGWALDVGGDGVLWSADDKSLLRRDGDGWTTISVPSNTDTNVPVVSWDAPEFAYGVDSDGVVWVLTVDGVASYDGNWHDHPIPDGATYGNQGMYERAWWTLGSNDTWTTFSLDVAGFAETGGSPLLTARSTFDGDEWSNTDGFFEADWDPASLGSWPEINEIATIQNEHLFVSTSIGLYWSDYQAGTTTILTIEDGLPSDFIRALADTQDGAVWIATDAGIARFVPDSPTT